MSHDLSGALDRGSSGLLHLSFPSYVAIGERLLALVIVRKRTQLLSEAAAPNPAAPCAVVSSNSHEAIEMDNVEYAIAQELLKRGSTSPSLAQDADAVRSSIGCSSLRFDAGLVRLSDMGVVGTIMSDLYLKQESDTLMQMFETASTG